MIVAALMATLLFAVGSSADEGQLRLVIGTRVTTHEGRGNVEIYHASRWGAVCDDEWDTREAAVVCRMLGFANATSATTNAHFGKALRQILMDNVYCNGHEIHIEECQFDGWGVHDCGREEAAGVICETDPEATTTTTTPAPAPLPKHKIRVKSRGSVKVRLAGGRSRSEGRLEVYIPKRGWGVVCGDGWGILEAMTACRQLGMRYAQDALQASHFLLFTQSDALYDTASFPSYNQTVLLKYDS